MSSIHISLDDVKGIFKVLAAAEYSSIFETRTLGFLKHMNELYGTAVHLFCTYEDGNFTLEKVSERYADEFKKNADWLKFGFHCYQEKAIYTEQDAVEFEQNFMKFQEQIKRITGQENQVLAIRHHGFWGNKHTCQVLRKNGITTLFTADDDRESYYLNDSAEQKLTTTGTYYDSEENLFFIKSVQRLENATNIAAEIKKRQHMGMNVIPVFTHEWQMDREDIRSKFEVCCRLERNMR